MKPTLEQIEQWQDHVDGGKDDRLFTHTQDWLTEFAELAYRAGAEKGKEAYEREHLRHTVPLKDALRVMQEQVAEACAAVSDSVDTFASSNPPVMISKLIRSGEWRAHLGET